MRQQAIRRERVDLRMIQARRRLLAASAEINNEGFPTTWRDAVGFIAMTLVIVVAITVVIGFALGIDSWPEWWGAA